MLKLDTDEMQLMLELTDGEPEFFACPFSPADEVAKKLPLRVARKQNLEGKPIWFPPPDRDDCLRDI